MKPILIILTALVIVGIVLYIHHRLTGGDAHVSQTDPETSPEPAAEENLTSEAYDKTTDPEVCCGLHEICEKFPDQNKKPVYYDDEELDAFAGRDANAYSDEETEMFRDVLVTLLASDVPGWWASIRSRGIELPSSLHDELMLRLSEGS